MVIAVAGKGGVGKTTVTSLLIRFLLEIDAPILAIDADPNSNLNVLLGMEHEETIADIREEAKNLTSNSMSKTEFFDMRLQEIVVEGKGVDLLVMGRPEGSGCYCAVNNILRDYLFKLGKNYKYVVIDNEAGMEHLSRRTANKIDLLLLVTDPTVVGIKSIINASRTAKKAGVKIGQSLVLINKSRNELSEDRLNMIEEKGLKIAGYIPYNENIEKASEKGENIYNIDVDFMKDIFHEIIN